MSVRACQVEVSSTDPTHDLIASYAVSLKGRPEPIDLCSAHAAQAVETGVAQKVVSIEATAPILVLG